MIKKRAVVISFIIGSILLFVLLIQINQAQESTKLARLPNYTEIRGQINIKEGINYDKQPYMGANDAKVKVVMFADYKCPACKNWELNFLDQFKRDFVNTGKVKLYFMNFAFIDRDSIMAASAGEAVAKQNMDLFWQYHRKIFEHQGDESKIWATPEYLLQLAEGIKGIDIKQLEQDLNERTYMLDVKEDFKIAGSLGVNGTPKFIINDVLLPTSDYNYLSEAIELEIAK
ncbi:DsbA family protein [Paenibacillus guangzhouensis]|uniref:DsbA family protein n=1 Tax=Paenibacillus guangzhouensis TaxID=1473112 RepID=UPI001266B864|nr:DsbA family protein [Paenibacillus guangzhouensis]